MNSKGDRKMLLPAICLWIRLSGLVTAQLNCGSLITYNQFDALLSEPQPECFRNGCEPSPANTISSTCNPNSPCYALWKILQTNFQPDWCASCSSDIACRIPGWPVLNATAACAVTPHEWLFTTGGSGCCTSDDEPVELAHWIGTMCNGSEWRQPFAYYGGMAREDWEEWILPWNWTLTAKNSSKIDVPEPKCPGFNSIGKTFMTDNLVRLAASIFEVGLTLGFCWKRRRGLDNSFWILAVIGGIVSAALWLVQNFLIAQFVAIRPGYEDVPVGQLMLILCTAPNITILLCGLGFWIPIFELEHPFRTSPIRGLRRQNAATEIRQYFAKVVLSTATTAMLMQIIAGVYFFKTAHGGDSKGFYRYGHLTRYWRGVPAYTMYAGALTWAICFVFTILSLYVLALAMAYKFYDEALSRHPHIYRFFLFIDRVLAKDFAQQELNADPEWTNRVRNLFQNLGESRTFSQWRQNVMRGVWLRTWRRMVTNWLWLPVIFLVRFSSPITIRVYYFLYEDWAGSIHDVTDRLEALADQARRLGLHRLHQKALATRPRTRDLGEDLRFLLIASVIFFWIPTYIAQWLFWTGLVEAMGPR